MITMVRFLILVAALLADTCAQEPPAATPTPAPATPAPATPPPGPPPISIEIDLTAQKAWVLQDGKRIYETPISSGRSSHPTPPGNFTVTEKDIDHLSSLYGRIVDSRGRIIDGDADSDTPVPPGAKFVRAPMKYFLRFDGAIGMHAGRLPGYPASHGCVRLPPGKAALFFNIAELGMPVRVFGQAPRSGTRPKAKAPSTPLPSPTPTPKRWFPWFRRS